MRFQLSVLIPPTRFELVSPAPKAGMIDHYTTGVERFMRQYSSEKRRCIIWLFGTIKDTFEPVVTDVFAVWIWKAKKRESPGSSGSDHDIGRGFVVAGFFGRLFLVRSFCGSGFMRMVLGFL